MRGKDRTTKSLFIHADMEEIIPEQHPLQTVKRVLDEVLASLDAEFEQLYSGTGRPSIPPERLIRACLIQMLLSIRSERQLVEQIGYNLLFRWFAGLSADDPVWTAPVFSMNRDRLLTTDMARKVMAGILEHPEMAPLLSNEHFPVDGTLIKAWASLKSFQPRPEEASDSDGRPGSSAAQDEAANGADAAPGPKPRKSRNPDVDFKGRKRSNPTHVSNTDPEARLHRKSHRTGADLYCMGHAPVERDSQLVVQATATQANGHAERDAALEMLDRQCSGSTKRRTVGADKACDAADFAARLQEMGITPHVARKARGSAIEGRTTRHKGYALSLAYRKQIEEAFGWAKRIGGMSQTVYRGLDRVDARFTFTMAANNLARLPRLLAA